MASSFLASIDRNIRRVKQEINAKVLTISIDLFLSVVRLTPSPTQRDAEYATGLLVNQWYPAAGNTFSSSEGTDQSDDGEGSKSRIKALRTSTEFLGKDGKLTLANNVHYAYRAEVLGWPVADGWGGKVGPYKMVALAIQATKAKYK